MLIVTPHGGDAADLSSAFDVTVDRAIMPCISGVGSHALVAEPDSHPTRSDHPSSVRDLITDKYITKVGLKNFRASIFTRDIPVAYRPYDLPRGSQFCRT